MPAPKRRTLGVAPVVAFALARRLVGSYQGSQGFIQFLYAPLHRVGALVVDGGGQCFDVVFFQVGALGAGFIRRGGVCDNGCGESEAMDDDVYEFPLILSSDY